MTKRKKFRQPMALLPSERGSGSKIAPDRLKEIEDYCWDQILNGAAQYTIAKQLGASKSRISRWVRSAIERHGDFRHKRFTKNREKNFHQLLLSRVDFSSADDCWRWNGTYKANGYGALTYGLKNHYAHRAMYELFIGCIPKDLVIDHLCENRWCVNPAHLQAVPQTVNIIRSYQ